MRVMVRGEQSEDDGGGERVMRRGQQSEGDGEGRAE